MPDPFVAFICLRPSFCSLSGSQGSAPTADQSHFTSSVHPDTGATPRREGPPHIPPNPPHVRAGRARSSVHYLRRLTELSPSGLDLRARLQPELLIVSALVMSACSGANSFLPLSPNSPKSCQQINTWLPTTHSSLSLQQAQARAAKSRIWPINVTPDWNLYFVSCPHPLQCYSLLQQFIS